MPKRLKNAIKILGVYGLLRLCFTKIIIIFLVKSGKKTYAQLFEDYFLNKYLSNKKEGFYVDVGANDPGVLNNTNHFCLKGWRGINIEPNSRLHEKFLIERPRDINLNMGVGTEKNKASFFSFDADVYSTFSEEEAQNREKAGYKITEIKEVEIDRLENILAKNLPENTIIDFISIDAEGLNLTCLQTNNWDKFRPKFICIETAAFNKPDLNKDIDIDNFLKSKKYKEIFFNGINSIYKDLSNK